MTDFSVAFLGMFESLRMGPTFARGRREERAGHVRSLTVSGSLAVALVRGPDDPAAFRARIAVRAFGASEWARVESALVTQAGFTAGLLDGRMPAGIEAVFAGAGLHLLPLSFDEVAMDCTCERWPMPCAHLAATCYALARAFETDPFEVFTWRGRSRDELLMRLRHLREAAAVTTAGIGDIRPGAIEAADMRSDAMEADGGRGRDMGAGGRDGDGRAGDRRGSAADAGAGRGGRRDAASSAVDPAAFWGAARSSDPEPEPAGARPDALLDQLDPPALNHHGTPVVEVLRDAYRALPDHDGRSATM